MEEEGAGPQTLLGLRYWMQVEAKLRGLKYSMKIVETLRVLRR